ncbi:hypothetical protein GCM10022216_14420 [Sphingobacterium kyonggiense]|uniref:Uncharacterized protein n=1 Tax=Sphingobacterium kyonggiense TaxID=714075 RepID=A0ABP7YNC3_9SPHI
MNNLTENQSKVLIAIKDNKNSVAAIIEACEMPKKSATGTLTSLLKANLIRKNADETYSLIESEPLSNDEVSDSKTLVNQVEDLSVINPDQENPMVLLIPYIKSGDGGEELKYALRSWEKNYTGPLKVIIVGEKEEWFSPEITLIPVEPHLIKEVCNCPKPSLILNPQADSTNKVFTALVAEDIKGEFILSNDDIFLLGNTLFADLQTLKAFKDDLDKTAEGDGIYAQNNGLASKALKANNLPVIRYGTHTPMVLNAEKLIDIIEKYKALENGYPLVSLYYNEVYPDARPIVVSGEISDNILASAYRDNIPTETLKTVFETRKFLNCNAKGLISIKPFLEMYFPNPSIYEYSN